jgi:hypothetical protein
LYDDHCCAFAAVPPPPHVVPPPAGSQSRGLLLKLNIGNHTASLAAQYPHNPTLDAAFTGSTQVLPNGNVLVGWGAKPYFSEYSKAGTQLLDAVWPGADLSYRVLLTPNWVGKPYFPPSGAVHKHHGRSTVYASWDGATQVASWEVLAGSNRKHQKVVATARKGGFETVINLKRAYRTYRVVALDSKRRALGTSGVFPKPSGGGFNPGSY